MKKLLKDQNRAIKEQAIRLAGINREIEEKVALRTAELDAERRKSVKSILIGQESERQRIGKDLHDSLNIKLIWLKRKLEVGIPVPDRGILTDIDSIIEQVREIFHNLYPYSLNELGLIKAAEDLCFKIKAQHGLDIRFSAMGTQNSGNWDKVMQSELFRVMQETFANILKHAGATSVYVEFIADDDLLFITIEVNGKGFDVDEVRNRGIGLKNSAARIDLLGGTIRYDKGYSVVQPPEPSREGKYQWNLQYSKGNYLMQGLIAKAKAGGGFYS